MHAIERSPVGPAPPLPSPTRDTEQWSSMYSWQSRSESLSRRPARLTPPPRNSNKCNGNQLEGSLFANPAFEALAQSLSDVEEALKQIAISEQQQQQVNQSSPNSLLLVNGLPAAETQRASLTSYSKLSTLTNANNQLAPGSPTNVSIATSVNTNRADSRNTNLSYDRSNGPALVEEMSLSDLEEELSSNLNHLNHYRANILNETTTSTTNDYLMAGESLLHSARSRQPLQLVAAFSKPSSRNKY